MLHKHDEEGPPCRHMEGLLQKTAEGSARGLGRWYAVFHAARCPRCGRFLRSLRDMIWRLRGDRSQPGEAEAIERLRKLVPAPASSSSEE